MTTWLTPQEAADHLKIGRALIAKAVIDGDLPAYPVGSGKRDYRLTADDVDAWMRSRSYEPNARTA